MVPEGGTGEASSAGDTGIGGGVDGSVGGSGGALVSSDGGAGGKSGLGGGAAAVGGTAGCVGARPPRVRFVAPYIALANHPTTLIVRGKNLDASGPLVKLNIGATQAGPVAADSDTQVTVQVPALPAGRYPVSVEGSNCSEAELVVLAPPALGYHAISTAGRRERLLWDAERQTIYAVNRTDQRIERYRYSAPDWTTLAPFAVPDLTDIALAPNGRSLLVSSPGALSEVQLDEEPLVAVLRAVNPDPSTAAFDTLNMTNDGSVFVVTSSHYSGFGVSYLYDMNDGSLARNVDGDLSSGFAGVSADGSRVYAGSNAVSPAQPVKIFDAFSHDIVEAAPAYDLRSVSASSNASRVILQDVDVYTRDLSLLGHLPPNAGALASFDSSRAFVFGESGAGAQLVVHDLNAPLGVGDVYPLVKEIDVPDSFSVASGARIAFTGTPDDSVVFVSGDNNILVVPVENAQQ